jgi:hypothetical protein
MSQVNPPKCKFCNGSGFINYLLLQCQPNENINFFTRIKKIFTNNNQICQHCKGKGYIYFRLFKYNFPNVLINSESVPNIVIMKSSKKKKKKKIKNKIYNNNRIHT